MQLPTTDPSRARRPTPPPSFPTTDLTESGPWPICPRCEQYNAVSDGTNTVHRCLSCGTQWEESPPPGSAADRDAAVIRPRVDDRTLARIAKRIERQDVQVERAAALLTDGFGRAGNALQSTTDALALALLGLAHEADTLELGEADWVRAARHAYQIARLHRRENGGRETEMVALLAVLKAQEGARS